MRHGLAALLLAAAVATTTGCATVQFGGGKQMVEIQSQPPGATALILPDDLLVETPIEVRIDRKTARTIRFEKEGYCRETVYLDRTISWSTALNLILGGAIGWWIDTRTGAAYTLQPELAYAFLWPTDSPDRTCGPSHSRPRRPEERLPPMEPL